MQVLAMFRMVTTFGTKGVKTMFQNIMASSVSISGVFAGYFTLGGWMATEHTETIGAHV